MVLMHTMWAAELLKGLQESSVKLRWPTPPRLSLRFLLSFVLISSAAAASLRRGTGGRRLIHRPLWRSNRISSSCTNRNGSSTLLFLKRMKRTTTRTISLHLRHRHFSRRILKLKTPKSDKDQIFMSNLTNPRYQNALNLQVITCLGGGSGVWFHSWTDLSQSDFLPFFSFFDSCSSFSSSSPSEWDKALLIGMNSSKTGILALDVCSEHSDCSCVL